MIPDSRQTFWSLSSCIADDIIRGMKFPIIRDFPGDQRKTGVSKSKLDAPPRPTVEQLDFRLVARGGSATKQNPPLDIVHNRGRRDATECRMALEANWWPAPLCCSLRVCLDGISAVKHGSLMWGQASQALGTNPEGDYSPTEHPYTTGSMPSVHLPLSILPFTSTSGLPAS